MRCAFARSRSQGRGGSRAMCFDVSAFTSRARAPVAQENEQIKDADLAIAAEVSRARSRAGNILALDAITLIGAVKCVFTKPLSGDLAGAVRPTACAERWTGKGLAILSGRPKNAAHFDAYLDRRHFAYIKWDAACSEGGTVCAIAHGAIALVCAALSLALSFRHIDTRTIGQTACPYRVSPLISASRNTKDRNDESCKRDLPNRPICD